MIDPIFICGHRKSGTSLFHSLLDGHSNLSVYPIDLNLLYLYFPEYNSIKFSIDQKKKRLQKVLFDDMNNQLKSLKITPTINLNEFSSVFFNCLKSESDYDDMKIIIRSLIDSFTKLSGDSKKIPVFKETSVEVYFDEIKEWFPDSKFIQIIRDPRDNYSSIKSGVKSHYSLIGEDENHSLSSLIYRVRLGFQIGKILNENMPDCFITIKFEDLVLFPKRELLKVSNFLKIPFEDSLLYPTKFSQNYTGNNFNNIKFKGISKINLNNWENRITNEESIIIEFFLKNEMEYFNYPLKYKDKNTRRVIADFYKWENYNYYFNDRL